MHDVQQPSLFAHTDEGKPILLGHTRVDKRRPLIEEDLACRLKSDSVFGSILHRLEAIPYECLATIEKEHVHDLCIYFVYILVNSVDSQTGLIF